MRAAVLRCLNQGLEIVGKISRAVYLPESEAAVRGRIQLRAVTLARLKRGRRGPVERETETARQTG